MCGICSLSGNVLLHPSKRLQELYAKKCYQGQDPDQAEIIFVGKDANWDPNIDKLPIWSLIEEYLNDDVEFWEKEKKHHPFLLCKKEIGGKKYHQRFSEIYTTHGKHIRQKNLSANLMSFLADRVSFVELVGFPTEGISSNYPEAFNALLYSCSNLKHLIRLDQWLNLSNGEETNKKIFVAYGAAKKLQQISEQTGLGLFKNFRKLKLKKMLPNGRGFHKFGNIYVHTHLSYAGRDVLRKIAQNI